MAVDAEVELLAREIMSSSSDAAAALELQESLWEELRWKARKLEHDLDRDACPAPSMAYLTATVGAGSSFLPPYLTCGGAKVLRPSMLDLYTDRTGTLDPFS